MAQPAIDRWLSRTANLATFWTLLPAGIIALATGYLAAGVQWISAYGPFGVLLSGLCGFLISSLSFALIARTKLWRLEAKARQRAIGDSSPFDPMETVYQGKRLYIRDLAPAGRRIVRNKKFIHCEIIGPANIVVGLRSSEAKPWPDFRNNIFSEDCDFIQIALGSDPRNGVAFVDCDFDGCTFWSVSLLFLQRLNTTWNWITPPLPDGSPDSEEISKAATGEPTINGSLTG